MPRRVVRPAAPPSTLPGHSWKATRHAVPTTLLLEFGPTWVDWNRVDSLSAGGIAHVKGAICKVIPPSGTPYSTVDALEAMLYKCGARVVRILPSLPEEKPVSVATKQAQVQTHRTLRQVALDRAKAMTNSHDQPALLALVNVAMDAAELVI